jgi:hypothetical protein
MEMVTRKARPLRGMTLKTNQQPHRSDDAALYPTTRPENAISRNVIKTRDLSETARTIHQRGTTIVPLDVKLLEDGKVHLRALDSVWRHP